MFQNTNPTFKSQNQQKQITLKPQNLLSIIGKQCPLCQNKITFSNSIAICQCKFAGHQQCIKKYLKTSQLKLVDVISCEQCHKIIEVEYEVKYKVCLKIRLQNSITIVLLTIVLSFMLGLISKEFEVQPNMRNLTTLSIYFLVVILITVCLLILVIFSIFRKQSEVKNIKKSKKHVVISAFEGIMTRIDEQNSSNMIFT